MRLILQLALVMSGIVCASGRIVFEGKVWSENLQTNRFVRIYVPPAYSEGAERYPVLYVHDGQNAFTTAGPHAAFGWGNWELDKTATELSQSGQMQEIIIVAIDCSSERYREYRGPARVGSNRWYDNYARFLSEELK